MMVDILLWVGDQFERGVSHDDLDGGLCYRVSQWCYRMAWRLCE